uniref:EF-hand domain-containing protein n=1 Tax=Eutreptiella gymnastica TaxID=73025 RepID=A0A7S1HZR5_9EUGL|mmetsp:Transcript_11746/g.21305  ORF Transcript_11746/g.21305 Transcript_11746/m.21305 type:complete len:1138 (+) Transcript_11746:145-3558(+)
MVRMNNSGAGMRGSSPHPEASVYTATHGCPFRNPADCPFHKLENGKCGTVSRRRINLSGMTKDEEQHVLNQLQDALQLKELTIQVLEKQNSQVKEEAAELNRRSTRHEDKIRSLVDELKSKEKQMNEVLLQAMRVQATHEEADAKLKRVQHLEEQHSKMSIELADAKHLVSKQAELLKELRKDTAAKDVMNTDLSVRNKVLQDKVSSLVSQQELFLAEKRTEVEHLQKELRHRNLTITETKARNIVLQDKVDHLISLQDQTSSEKEKEVNELRQALLTEQSMSQQRARESKSALESLQQSLRELEVSKAAAVANVLQDKREVVEALRKESDGKDSVITDLKARNIVLQDKVEDLLNTQDLLNAEKDREIAELRQQILKEHKVSEDRKAGLEKLQLRLRQMEAGSPRRPKEGGVGVDLGMVGPPVDNGLPSPLLGGPSSPSGRRSPRAFGADLSKGSNANVSESGAVHGRHETVSRGGGSPHRSTAPSGHSDTRRASRARADVVNESQGSNANVSESGAVHGRHKTVSRGAGSPHRSTAPSGHSDTRRASRARADVVNESQDSLMGSIQVSSTPHGDTPFPYSNCAETATEDIVSVQPGDWSPPHPLDDKKTSRMSLQFGETGNISRVSFRQAAGSGGSFRQAPLPASASPKSGPSFGVPEIPYTDDVYGVDATLEAAQVEELLSELHSITPAAEGSVPQHQMPDFLLNAHKDLILTEERRQRHLLEQWQQDSADLFTGWLTLVLRMRTMQDTVNAQKQELTARQQRIKKEEEEVQKIHKEYVAERRLAQETRAALEQTLLDHNLEFEAVLQKQKQEMEHQRAELHEELHSEKTKWHTERETEKAELQKERTEWLQAKEAAERQMEAIRAALDQFATEKKGLEESRSALEGERRAFEAKRRAFEAQKEADEVDRMIWGDRKQDALTQLQYETLTLDDTVHMLKSTKAVIEQHRSEEVGRCKFRSQLINEAYRARAAEHWQREAALVAAKSAPAGNLSLMPAGHQWPKPEWWMYADVAFDLHLLMQVRRTFLAADVDKSGKLDIKKLGDYCLQQGCQNVTYEQLRSMLTQVDLRGQNAVDFWAFLGIQLYISLDLRSKSIPLLDWMSFCTYSSAAPPAKKVIRGWKKSAKPWYRDNAWQ